MSLYVSIHDVTPALAHGVVRAWNLCRIGGLRPALLVVPNWHGRWPLDAHPCFVRWLQECAAGGADLLLHGFRHDEEGLPRGLSHELRALGRTAREGEFLTLDFAAARARIEDGLALLRSEGLDPIGFVAPAWLAREATVRAAASLGLALYEDTRGVHLLGQGRVLPSPVIRWSARTPLRAALSALVADARWLTQRRVAQLRIAIHPPDVENPETLASVERTLVRFRAGRPVGRYRDLLPPSKVGEPPRAGAAWALKDCA